MNSDYSMYLKSRICRLVMGQGYNVFNFSALSRHQCDQLEWCCSQENQGAWGWQLPNDDYDTLSSMDFQLKYFDGGFVVNENGPYRTYEDLWDEPKPWWPPLWLSEIMPEL